jgi:hypothetical protein
MRMFRKDLESGAPLPPSSRIERREGNSGGDPVAPDRPPG